MLADGWFTTIVFAPDAEAQLLAARHLAANVAANAHARNTGGHTVLGPLVGAGRVDGPMKLGHLNPHAIGDKHAAMQTAPATMRHDRSRFQVWTYVISEDTPDGRHVDQEAWKVTRASSDQLFDLSMHPDSDVVRRVRKAGLHIALDHGGYCRYSRPGVLSLRIAPIQINYPCFLATLGADRRVSGYFVSDATISPPWAATGFSEAMVLLPHYHFTEHRDYFPLQQPQPTRHTLFVFAMLNTIYKLCPQMMSVLVNVLRSSSPEAVLWLKHKENDVLSDRSRQSLLLETLSRGLIVSRVRWKLNSESKQAHLVETAQGGDLFLDTIRVNAVWTAFDMLWAGLPLLSVSAEKMASRISASLSASVGLDSALSTQSLKEYEDMAREMQAS